MNVQYDFNIYTINIYVDRFKHQFLKIFGYKFYMKSYLLILPVALLVTYSQIIVKWRASRLENFGTDSFLQQLVKLLSDPAILSGYTVALIASLGWLFVITKLPLTTAFPIYIGITFILVLLCGWFFLSENMSIMKVISIFLISSGIVLAYIYK